MKKILVATLLLYVLIPNGYSNPQSEYSTMEDIIEETFPWFTEVSVTERRRTFDGDIYVRFTAIYHVYIEQRIRFECHFVDDVTESEFILRPVSCKPLRSLYGDYLFRNGYALVKYIGTLALISEQIFSPNEFEVE